MAGKRFGTRVVLPDSQRFAHGQLRWRVRCEACGDEKYIAAWHLGKPCRRCRIQTHGEGYRAGGRITPEYKIWLNMKQRCCQVGHRQYARYGAKGVTLCVQWRDSYETFLADVGRKPTPVHQLDRIDNARGYEPPNVRWATPSEQARNRRSNIRITLEGETRILIEWCERLNMPYKVVHGRLQRGWSAEKALYTPVMRDAAETAL